jgi:hypothetical protein
MTIRMMSPLPARMIQVLKDFLPAELDLIDAEEADGITTPDIGTSDYYEWDRQVIPEFPACSIRSVSSTPIDAQQIESRIDARHRLDVMFHVTANVTDGDSPNILKYLYRYITGAMRVLVLQHEHLDTTGDPNQFVSLVEWPEPATYGPEAAQEDGSIVRTATLPIDIRQIEAR